MDEVEELARRIKQLKIAPLASFLIESHRPLAGMFHTLAIAGAPFAAPFGAAKLFESCSKVFESQKSIDDLLARIADSKEDINGGN